MLINNQEGDITGIMFCHYNRWFYKREGLII